MFINLKSAERVFDYSCKPTVYENGMYKIPLLEFKTVTNFFRRLKTMLQYFSMNGMESLCMALDIRSILGRPSMEIQQNSHIAEVLRCCQNTHWWGTQKCYQDSFVFYFYCHLQFSTVRLQTPTKLSNHIISLTNHEHCCCQTISEEMSSRRLHCWISEVVNVSIMSQQDFFDLVSIEQER